MATRNENSGITLELIVGDIREPARSRKPVLSLHALNQLVLPPAFVEISSKGEKRFTIGVWLGFFALWGSEGDFVAGFEELLEWLGELHKEKARGFGNIFAVGID